MKKIKCSICKEKKPLDKMIGDICLDCASSLIQEDDLDLGMV